MSCTNTLDASQNYWFVPLVADTSGALHPETPRLLYDFARLKTDAAEQHAVANSLRSPLTPEQLCQRRGAGSGLLPRFPPPTCSRPVSGVGLGVFCIRFLTAASRPLLSTVFALRSAAVVSILSRTILSRTFLSRTYLSLSNVSLSNVSFPHVSGV
jgi:hypothetical protein